jgi:hypothetical protein
VPAAFATDDDRGRIALRATLGAFDALGIDPADADDDAEPTGKGADAEATDGSARGSKSKKRTRADAGTTRADTAQAQLIAMLKRPEGATRSLCAFMHSDQRAPAVVVGGAGRNLRRDNVPILFAGVNMP